MKKTLIIAIIVGLCFTACTPSLETRQETFQRMDAEIKANAKAYTTLQEATSTIGHRLTGSTNGAKAETYTYEKFKEYGFSDVAYQPFEVESWSRG